MDCSNTYCSEKCFLLDFLGYPKMHRASEALHLEQGYPPEHLAFLTRQRLQALLARCLEISSMSGVSICCGSCIMLKCYLLVLVFLLHSASAPEACYISYTNEQRPSRAHWFVCDKPFPVRHVNVWGRESFRVVHALGSRDVGSGSCSIGT
jgi:hypothetical protein